LLLQTVIVLATSLSSIDDGDGDGDDDDEKHTNKTASYDYVANEYRIQYCIELEETGLDAELEARLV